MEERCRVPHPRVRRNSGALLSQEAVIPSDKAERMVDKRSNPRYFCSRKVEAELFRAERRYGVRTARVQDISEGGLLLAFEAPVPTFDRVVVRTAGVELAYTLRRAYVQDGLIFAGVQVTSQ